MPTELEAMVQAAVSKLYEFAAIPVSGNITMGMLVLVFLIIILVMKLMED